MSDAATDNSDTVLHIFKHDESDPFSHQDHVFLTAAGGIGFCVGGVCIVKPPKAWHAMAMLEADYQIDAKAFFGGSPHLMHKVGDAPYHCPTCGEKLAPPFAPGDTCGICIADKQK